MAKSDGITMAKISCGKCKSNEAYGGDNDNMTALVSAIFEWTKNNA